MSNVNLSFTSSKLSDLEHEYIIKLFGKKSNRLKVTRKSRETFISACVSACIDNTGKELDLWVHLDGKKFWLPEEILKGSHSKKWLKNSGKEVWRIIYNSSNTAKWKMLAIYLDDPNDFVLTDVINLADEGFYNPLGNKDRQEWKWTFGLNWEK